MNFLLLDFSNKCINYYIFTKYFFIAICSFWSISFFNTIKYFKFDLQITFMYYSMATNGSESENKPHVSLLSSDVLDQIKIQNLQEKVSIFVLF